MPFERHNARYYAQRRSWNRCVKINGRPAWVVLEERKRDLLEKQGDDASNKKVR